MINETTGQQSVTLSLEEYTRLVASRAAEEQDGRGRNRQAVGQASRAEATEINLRDIFRALLHHIWLIILVTVICAGGMGYYSVSRYVPEYTATAKMYVNTATSVGGVKLTLSDLNTAKSLVDTYDEILHTYLTMDEVARQLDAELDPSSKTYAEDHLLFGATTRSAKKLMTMVECGALNGTEVIYIRVTDTDPARAVTIVNKIVDVLPEQIATVIDGASARTVDKARNTEVVNPGITRKILLAGLIGLVLGCAYAVLMDLFINDTVNDTEWLAETFADVPVLAEVPDVAQSHRKKGYSYGYYRSSPSKSGNADNRQPNKIRDSKGNRS